MRPRHERASSVTVRNHRVRDNNMANWTGWQQHSKRAVSVPHTNALVGGTSNGVATGRKLGACQPVEGRHHRRLPHINGMVHIVGQGPQLVLSCGCRMLGPRRFSEGATPSVVASPPALRPSERRVWSRPWHICCSMVAPFFWQTRWYGGGQAGSGWGGGTCCGARERLGGLGRGALGGWVVGTWDNWWEGVLEGG